MKTRILYRLHTNSYIVSNTRQYKLPCHSLRSSQLKQRLSASKAGLPKKYGKEDTDISDLAISASLVTLEKTEDDEDLFGKGGKGSNVKRMVDENGQEVVMVNEMSKVDEIVGGDDVDLDALSAKIKSVSSAGGGGIEDVMKVLSAPAPGDVGEEDGVGEMEPEGGAFDFNAYINGEQDNSDGGGLFG